MSDEVININEVKTTSDGTVKISIEKYNELLEKAAVKPPVIKQTTVNKTAEMLAKETRMWGGGLMGLGVSLFVVGACIYKAGLSKKS